LPAQRRCGTVTSQAPRGSRHGDGRDVAASIVLGTRFASAGTPLARIVTAMESTIDHMLSVVRAPRGPEPLSIQEIIRRHHGALIKFLRRRLSVADDAEDVAQETYIRMMKYEGSCELNSPSAMLFRIAVNVANDHGRSAVARHASRHSELQEMEFVSEAPSAERELLASQNFELVLQAIEALPPKCRQVFLLSRASDMTYPDIATHCGISVKMVEKHISKAIAACLAKVGA
jgi:RNA polymerase sigma factor (sigma-70 family)